MAGGTWIDQNKIRPGVYINYSSVPTSLAVMGERGVVCLTKLLDWGKENEVITIEDPLECFVKLGYDQMSDQLIWLRQILLGTNRTSGASKVLIWRLGTTGAVASTGSDSKNVTAQKASATLGDLTVTAKNDGVAGNNLSVSIEDGGSSNFIVKTFEGDVEKNSQTVTAITDLTANDYVTFSGSGSLVVTDKTPLTGGVDGFAGSISITAQCKGTRGNAITVVVTPDPDNTDTRCIFYVQTLVDGSLVDTQTLKASAKTVALSGLVANDWVTFTGSTGDAFAASITLSGGANGTESSNAFSDFLSAIEKETWNVLAYGGDVLVKQSSVKSFVERLCNDEGKKVQAVLFNYSADSECVISVANQHITDNSGHTLTDEEMVYWVAGASAGANANESLTYAAHPDAVSITPSFTSSQQRDAITGGQFAFIEEFGDVKNLQDINTFTTFAPTKGKVFSKNRVIRVLFGLANDIYEVFAKYYIGNTSNDDFGRGLLKGEILNLLNRYQGNGAVQNVEADDVTVEPGNDSDAVVIESNVQPVDSTEKIYINITIS